MASNWILNQVWTTSKWVLNGLWLPHELECGLDALWINHERAKEFPMDAAWVLDVICMNAEWVHIESWTSSESVSTTPNLRMNSNVSKGVQVFQVSGMGKDIWGKITALRELLSHTNISRIKFPTINHKVPTRNTHHVNILNSQIYKSTHTKSVYLQIRAAYS